MIFICSLFLPLWSYAESNDKISKCCPLGQMLFSGGCVHLQDGLQLPKIRVESEIVSFEELHRRDSIRQGFVPSCTESGEVYPDFTETSTLMVNMPYFSKDGVFVHELMYYKPEDYCIDGEIDSYEYQDEMEEQEPPKLIIKEASVQLPYFKVHLCEEKAKNVGGECFRKDQNCYPRYI